MNPSTRPELLSKGLLGVILSLSKDEGNCTCIKYWWLMMKMIYAIL
jgi:hypothetical protein